MMKNYIKRITAVVLCCTVILGFVPVTELIGEAKGKGELSWDGSFESHILGEKPKNWKLVSCNSAGKESSDSFDGNYDLVVAEGRETNTKSLMVAGKDGTKGYVLAKSDRIKVSAGTAHNLNYRMKIEGAEQDEVSADGKKTLIFYGANLWLIQYDKSGKEIKREMFGGQIRTNMDWESYAKYFLPEQETTEISLALYVGGVWQRNQDLKVYLDEISVDKLSDKAIINGDFESGEGNNDILSWHLRSTSVVNKEPTTADWRGNYELKRIEGYHGDGVSITRKGIGYVALDSNLMKIEKKTTYMIDFAYAVSDASKTFVGLGTYISEYDKNKELLSRFELSSRFKEDTDWKEASYSYTPDSDAVYFCLEFSVGDFGANTTFTVKLDDVRLTAIQRITSKDGVNNGNFEEVLDGTIFNWTFRDRTGVSYASTFDGYNNTKGLYCKKTGDEHGYSIIQSSTFQVTEGKDYKLSYMGRFKNQVGNTYVTTNMDFYDADGKHLGAFTMDNLRTYSDEWQQVTGYFKIPKGAKTGRVQMLICGTSYDCWIDDVKWSTYDPKADIWGFDTVNKNGDLAGWSISTQPKAMKLDQKTYREGTGSIFVSQTSNTSMTRITSDILIPVEPGTRYKFTAWVKSYSCNTATEPIRLNAITYDKDGKKIGEVIGLYKQLNEDSEPSEWKELILGVYGMQVAYVRPVVVIAAGTMNLWVDDLQWKLYDIKDEFAEDFDSVRDDGTPDGWTAEIQSGAPLFATGDSAVKIEAKNKDDVGVLRGRWDTAVEYSRMKYTTTYCTTGGAKAKITIKFFDFNDKEIKNARFEKALESTGGKTVDTSFDFLLTSAKYMHIEISNEGAGSVILGGIHIARDGDSESEGVATWRGKWIWYQEDYQDSMGSKPRYFRYHFTIPDAPASSNIQITADDSLKLWVNGVSVHEENMDKTFEYISVINDFAQYLVPGENVIAVRAYNISSICGLLFDGYVETENGEWIDFYSDERTLTTANEYEGWEQKEFDDSGWISSKIVDLAVGGNSWADMEYDNSAYVKNQFEVVDYTVTEEMKAGEDAVLTMTIVPTADIETPVAMSGHLWRRNSGSKVLSAEFEQIDGPEMKDWKAGKKIKVSYKFNIPDYIKTGKYIIQLEQSAVKITNMDVINNKLVKAIKVENDQSANSVKAEFRSLNGTQALYINDEMLPVMSYAEPAQAQYQGSPSVDVMHDAGLCITRLWLAFETSTMTDVWTGDTEYNWEPLDEMIYELLGVHNDSYLMLTLGLDVPTWWKEQNPDELVLTNKGTSPGVSFFSEKAYSDVMAANRAMLAHMKEQPYWNRIIGSVLTAGEYSEWFWYGSGNVSMDHSKLAEDSWRKWLKEKYGTDKALREAWNDSTATIDTAKVPYYEEREGTNYDTLLDPKTQQDVLDFTKCIEETEVKLLIKFATEITEIVEDRWILGAYFAYTYSRLLMFDAPLKMHTEADMAVDHPNIDFFAAPANYSERYDGESHGFCNMADGILAHGKTVIMEDDLRLCSFDYLAINFYTRDSMGPTYNISDSLSNMQHSYLSQITHGLGNWYYNLNGNFFEREQFSRLIATMRSERMVDYAREKDYHTDIAYIIDEDIYSNLAYNYDANYEVMVELLYEQHAELTRIGASMNYYTMTDLEEGLVPDHKLYIIIGSSEVDQSERETINKYLKNGGKTVLWQYICGASDGTTFSAENMSEVIGMDVELNGEKSGVAAIITTQKHWLTQGLEGTTYGSARINPVVNPTAYVTDKDATVLAYMKDAGNKAALAVKEMEDWTSIFSAAPCYTSEMIRNVIEKCGIHSYSDDTNDVIYANSNYVGINCAYGGEKTIKLDGTYAVYDVFGQTTYSLSTDEIKFDMDDNSTKLFRLSPVGKHGIYLETGSNGTSEQSGYHELDENENYNCKIKAKEGYLISEIVVDGKSTEIEKKNYTVKFKNLNNSHYVQVKYIKQLQDNDVAETLEGNGMSPAMKYILVGVIALLVLAGGSITAVNIVKRKGEQKRGGNHGENKKQ